MTTPMTRRSLREQTAPVDVPVESSGARRGRGLGRVIADSLLWIAAVGGVLCIALVVLALTANITLIMFRTGSMSPTIPAGSVAVVQRVPASEIAVGDVVTVDREPELPVTHRVTSVQTGETDATRVITMRGDANEQDDPFPYTVESVRIVRFAIPGIAHAIAAFGDPIVLGGLTIAAALLVGWAFWPRDTGETGRRDDRRRRGGGDT